MGHIIKRINKLVFFKKLVTHNNFSKLQLYIKKIIWVNSIAFDLVVDI